MRSESICTNLVETLVKPIGERSPEVIYTIARFYYETDQKTTIQKRKLHIWEQISAKLFLDTKIRSLSLQADKTSPFKITRCCTLPSNLNHRKNHTGVFFVISNISGICLTTAMSPLRNQYCFAAPIKPTLPNMAPPLRTFQHTQERRENGYEWRTENAIKFNIVYGDENTLL